MKGKMRSTAGFTLVEIMIVVAIIGFLAAIAIPNFIRARSRSQTQACINNLRQIDSATQQWATEFKKASSAIPQKSDIDPYIGRTGHAGGVLCPAGGSDATFASSYTLNEVTNQPSCNILPTGPGAHVLGGD